MGSWLLSPILLLAAGVSSWEMHLGFWVTFFLGGGQLPGHEAELPVLQAQGAWEQGGTGWLPWGI